MALLSCSSSQTCRSHSSKSSSLEFNSATPLVSLSSPFLILDRFSISFWNKIKSVNQEVGGSRPTTIIIEKAFYILDKKIWIFYRICRSKLYARLVLTSVLQKKYLTLTFRLQLLATCSSRTQFIIFSANRLITMLATAFSYLTSCEVVGVICLQFLHRLADSAQFLVQSGTENLEGVEQLACECSQGGLLYFGVPEVLSVSLKWNFLKVYFFVVDDRLKKWVKF